jgi:hypothetical protein
LNNPPVKDPELIRYTGERGAASPAKGTVTVEKPAVWEESEKTPLL